MDVKTVIFWVILLVTQEVYMEEGSLVEEVTTTPLPAVTNAVNTIDVLQNQLNQILVQFCASEIDRNKTGSAILKFGQLANPTASIKSVVNFYIENYKESFDNLLHFIQHISSYELQQIAYSTLLDAIKLNQINVIDLLSFESFVRTKFELLDENHSIERKTYKDLLLTVGGHVKELIISTDLNKFIMFINSMNNAERLYELIPTIVQGIDLNNFTDMNRIFEFSMQLPKENQIKLIGKVLDEMEEKSVYKHLFHVIGQIRKLRNSFNNYGGWTQEYKCLLLKIEKKVPIELRDLLSKDSTWQLEFYDSRQDSSESDSRKFLSYTDSSVYSKNILFLKSEKLYNGWQFSDQIFNFSIRRYDYNEYLSVEYCFHNDSFPTVKSRDVNDRTQDNWYLLMSDDLRYVQIKNIYTNEMLIVEDLRELKDPSNNMIRIVFSANCSDCEGSKWLLQLENAGNSENDYSNCN